MEMEKYEIYRAFCNNQEKTLKVRHEKSTFRDKVKRALFRNDLEKLGFTGTDISRAIKRGWVKEKVIWHENRHRSVILWMDQDLISKNVIKRMFQKQFWQLLIKNIKEKWAWLKRKL